MTNEDCRAAFERAAQSGRYGVSARMMLREASGDYMNPITSLLWNVWRDACDSTEKEV